MRIVRHIAIIPVEQAALAIKAAKQPCESDTIVSVHQHTCCTDPLPLFLFMQNSLDGCSAHVAGVKIRRSRPVQVSGCIVTRPATVLNNTIAVMQSQTQRRHRAMNRTVRVASSPTGCRRLWWQPRQTLNRTAAQLPLQPRLQLAQVVRRRLWLCDVTQRPVPGHDIEAQRPGRERGVKGIVGRHVHQQRQGDVEIGGEGARGAAAVLQRTRLVSGEVRDKVVQARGLQV